MRARGEGSIYFDESKRRWYASLSLPGGKRVKRSAKTQREARALLEELQRNARIGIVAPGPSYTVGQFLADWLPTVKPRVRPRTYRTYADKIAHHLDPHLGHVPISRLSPPDVQRMMQVGLDAGLSPSTVGRNRAVLRAALADAIRWGLIERNVAALTRPPRAERKPANPLTPDEARALLTAVKGDRLEALYHVAIGIGLRQGEILGLRWSDIDLDSGELRVTNALQRLEGEWVLAEPKSERSKRQLDIPTLVGDKLAEHRLRQDRDQDGAPESWPDLVFTTASGRPIESRNLSRAYHRALARAGLSKRRFHDLRHTCASFLLAQGVSARVVMEVMGHSQISVTLNTYGHLMPGQLSEAANRMDDLLRGI